MKKVFAKTIHKELSPISGQIVVKDNGVTRELFVKGVKQTSWSEEESIFEGTYWKAAVNIPFEIKGSPRFLVIGLGGGTIPKLLTKQYPDAEIVCIEIDPSIVSIAKDLFNIGDYKNVKIITSNANDWIHKNAVKYENHFDGIFLDGFFGEVFSIDTDLLMVQKVHKMLKNNGVMITNRIYNEYEKNVDAFIMQISELFHEQVTHIIEGYSGNDNIIIFSKKSKQ
jgi:spermidine synthase